MHSDVNSVIRQSLGGSCERNQGRDTATGKEDLAILAGQISVQVGIFCSHVAINDDGVPIVTYFGLRRAAGGVAVADNFGIVAIDASGVRQFTNGIMAYPCKPFAKAD